MPTIEGRKLKLAIDMVKPQSMQRIGGQGLPHPKQPSKRGDLIVEFDIQFPDHLSTAAKRTLSEVLPRTSYAT